MRIFNNILRKCYSQATICAQEKLYFGLTATLEIKKFVTCAKSGKSKQFNSDDKDKGLRGFGSKEGARSLNLRKRLKDIEDFSLLPYSLVGDPGGLQMFRNWAAIPQAFIASMYTWGVTALGAAVVFFIPPHNKKLLDVSLGLAAGIMTAASFWSLLAPAIELAEAELHYLAFIPVSIGFALGAGFVYTADRLMPGCILSEMTVVELLTEDAPLTVPKSMIELKEYNEESHAMIATDEKTFGNDATRYGYHQESNSEIRQRRPNQFRTKGNGSQVDNETETDIASSDAVTTTVTMTEANHRATEQERNLVAAISWRRIVLLIVAVTVHNIPEGLAVGVAFGSIGKAAKATFESAFTLALGIGLQNFPEGLAVSLPLAAFGHSKTKAFFYGQLSGMVEPVAALAGAAAVILMEPVLPYALSFAAGAMIFVVVDDIIPEAQRNGNGKLASIGAIVGFLVMMSLDVGLG